MTAEVDLHHLFPIINRKLDDRNGGSGDTGTVDQNVNATQRRQGLPGGTFHRGEICDVNFDAAARVSNSNLSALLPDPVSHGLADA